MEYSKNSIPKAYPTRFLITLDYLLSNYPTFARIIENSTTYQPVDLDSLCEPSNGTKYNLAKYFFPEVSSRITAKFNRTAMAIVLSDAVIFDTPENYEFLTALQPEDAKLTRETYHKLSDAFYSLKINATELRLLDFLIIMRGYANTPQARRILARVTGREISPMFPTETLKGLWKRLLITEAGTLPLAEYEIIRRAVRSDFSLTSLMSGESSCALNTAFEDEDLAVSKRLILAAGFFEAIASGGNINQIGSTILTEEYAKSYLDFNRLFTKGTYLAYYYKEKADKLMNGHRDFTFEEAVAAIRLSHLMGLGNSAARCIANLMAEHYPDYSALVRELNIGFPWDESVERPVVLYYGRNYLSALHRAYSEAKCDRPVQNTLEEASPILVSRIKALRKEALKNPPQSNLLYLDLTEESTKVSRRIEKLNR